MTSRLCSNCRLVPSLADSDRCVDCEGWSFGDPVTKRGRPMSCTEHAFKRAVITFISAQAHLPTLAQLARGTGLAESECAKLAFDLADKKHLRLDHAVVPMRVMPVFYENDMRIQREATQ